MRPHYAELGHDPIAHRRTTGPEKRKRLPCRTGRPLDADVVVVTGSERAFDLYMKTRFLHEQHPGHGVTFATGTPISNTMVEMYTIQRYLDPDGLSSRGIDHFDAWAATFGEVIDTLEISPDGAGLRPRSRFARFSPSLVKYYQDYRYSLVRCAVNAFDFHGDCETLGKFLEPPLAPALVRKYVQDLEEWGLIIRGSSDIPLWTLEPDGTILVVEIRRTDGADNEEHERLRPGCESTLRRARPLSDLAYISIWCDPKTLAPCTIGEGVRVRMTTEHWVMVRPRGYLCSEEC